MRRRVEKKRIEKIEDTAELPIALKASEAEHIPVPTSGVIVEKKPPKLTAEQKKLKEILKTAPLKPNDLRKRYMYETWFPAYEEFVRKLVALAS